MGRGTANEHGGLQQRRGVQGIDVTDQLVEERCKLEQRIDSEGRPFIQVGPEPNTFSGWKLHVFCPHTDAVKIALSRLHADAIQFGWGMKVATEIFFLMAPEGTPQHGKGVTIYLPHRATADDELDWIKRLLDGYPFSGAIAGDEMVTPALGRRFEFHPDPQRDVDRREYDRWYRPSAAYLAHAQAQA